MIESFILPLALTVWFECRGCDDPVDRVAVAQVVMNRVEDSGEFRRYSSPAEVVSQPGHFPWYGRQLKIENSIDRAAWKDAVSIARMVYEGYVQDVTDGSKWFHTNRGMRRSWTMHKTPIAVGSGVHKFWTQ